MCFTNLPIEIDENGDPYLADDADDIEHRSEAADRDDSPDLETYGCLGDDPGVPISELDDEDTYAAVMETLPKDVREGLHGGESDSMGVDSGGGGSHAADSNGNSDSRTIVAGG